MVYPLTRVHLVSDSPRLLLVEKDPGDETLIVDALRSAGFVEAIGIAHDGAEALEYLFASDRGADANPRVVLLSSDLEGLFATGTWPAPAVTSAGRPNSISLSAPCKPLGPTGSP